MKNSTVDHQNQKDENPEIGPSTQSVHLAERVDPSTRSIMQPMVANSAFAFKDLAEWRDVANRNISGDIYSRNSNPTTSRLEEKLSALEGAERAVSFATGMAAISTTLFALLSPKNRVVTVRDAYGATYLHFTEILPRFDIECEVCTTSDHNEIVSAINQECTLVYLETPTNPTLKILDLAKLIETAHRNNAIVVVDNTFATPINQNPIALGADLVIHSATKFLCGHGDVMGGIVCGKEHLIEKIYRHRELTGPSLDANSAFLLLRSLKTLGLRIQRQNDTAMTLAKFLSLHPKIDRVYYPGLETHPRHDVAKKQMRGFGGVLSFELLGGMEAAAILLPKLKYAYMAPNLGQVETIVGPAALTSHVELNEEERKASGVPDGLVRYAVGIEDKDDLINDLEEALAVL